MRAFLYSGASNHCFFFIWCWIFSRWSFISVKNSNIFFDFRAFDAFYPGSFGFWSSIRKLMLHVAGNANLMEHFTNNPTIIDVFISYNPNEIKKNDFFSSRSLIIPPHLVYAYDWFAFNEYRPSHRTHLQCTSRAFDLNGAVRFFTFFNSLFWSLFVLYPGTLYKYILNFINGHAYFCV